MTYQGANTDGVAAGNITVGSGDDSVGIEEGAAAKVAAAGLERDNVGELALGGGLSTDDEGVELGGTEAGLGGVLGGEGSNQGSGHGGGGDSLAKHFGGCEEEVL